MKGSGRGQIEGAIPRVRWTSWQRQKNRLLWSPVSGPKFKPGESPPLNTKQSAKRSTMTFRIMFRNNPCSRLLCYATHVTGWLMCPYTARSALINTWGTRRSQLVLRWDWSLVTADQNTWRTGSDVSPCRRHGSGLSTKRKAHERVEVQNSSL